LRPEQLAAGRTASYALLGQLRSAIDESVADFEVLEPLELADRVRFLAERFTRAADRAGRAR
jgi:hypothetical protein